jgi:hypothetical protein
MPEAYGKKGWFWQTARSLAGVGVLLSIMFLLHALVSGQARDFLAHHAGDPLWVHLSVIGSALLLFAGPVILLVGLHTIRKSLVGGVILLLLGGFLSAGLLHFYPGHIIGLNDTFWGTAAEAFGLLLPLAVVLLGFIHAWRARRTVDRRV